MSKHRSLVLAIIAVLGASGGVVAIGQENEDDPPPPGVQQLMPRGRIAAVFEPQFVSVAQAEIADDAWILGVVVEGQAKAYSLNLLNRHEVVNDQSGETEFAAVW